MRRNEDDDGSGDPELAHHTLLAGEVRLFLGDDDADFLLKS